MEASRGSALSWGCWRTIAQEFKVLTLVKAGPHQGWLVTAHCSWTRWGASSPSPASAPWCSSSRGRTPAARTGDCSSSPSRAQTSHRAPGQHAGNAKVAAIFWGIFHNICRSPLSTRGRSQWLLQRILPPAEQTPGPIPTPLSGTRSWGAELLRWRVERVESLDCRSQHGASQSDHLVSC